MKLSTVIQDLKEKREANLKHPSNGFLDGLILDWHRRFVDHYIEQLELVDSLE